MLIFARVPINGQGVKDKCAALNCLWSIKEGNLFPHRTTNHRLIIVMGIISAIRQFKVSFVLFAPFCMGGTCRCSGTPRKVITFCWALGGGVI